MMLLGASAVVAMAMLASPGLHALRLHSTAKTTCRSLPHKNIPSFGRTTGTYVYARCEATRSRSRRYIRQCAIVAGPRSRHPRNVAASRPRAPLTLRSAADPRRSTSARRAAAQRDGKLGSARTTIRKSVGKRVSKKRTPTRLTFYYSHPLRPAPSSRATTFRSNCSD